MVDTTTKGEIGEAMVVADLRKRGFGVAIPFGHDVPFDLMNQSNSAWVSYRYTASDVDWLAVYDATTDRCYYIHSSVFDGMSQLILRLAPPANNQRRFIRWARDYLHPTLPDRQRPGPGRLPFRFRPE